MFSKIVPLGNHQFESNWTDLSVIYFYFQIEKTQEKDYETTQGKYIKKYLNYWLFHLRDLLLFMFKSWVLIICFHIRYEEFKHILFLQFKTFWQIFIPGKISAS